jgi:transcriptional regulator with XRE-family HTH domain
MIYEKVVSYCKEHHMTIMAFERLCGLANGVVGKWEKDKLNPSLASLTKIADATGIPVADWLSND